MREIVFRLETQRPPRMRRAVRLLPQTWKKRRKRKKKKKRRRRRKRKRRNKLSKYLMSNTLFFSI